MHSWVGKCIYSSTVDKSLSLMEHAIITFSVYMSPSPPLACLHLRAVFNLGALVTSICVHFPDKEPAATKYWKLEDIRGSSLILLLFFFFFTAKHSSLDTIFICTWPSGLLIWHTGFLMKKVNPALSASSEPQFFLSWLEKMFLTLSWLYFAFFYLPFTHWLLWRALGPQEQCMALAPRTYTRPNTHTSGIALLGRNKDSGNARRLHLNFYCFWTNHCLEDCWNNETYGPCLAECTEKSQAKAKAKSMLSHSKCTMWDTGREKKKKRKVLHAVDSKVES